MILLCLSTTGSLVATQVQFLTTICLFVCLFEDLKRYELFSRNLGIRRIWITEKLDKLWKVRLKVNASASCRRGESRPMQ